MMNVDDDDDDDDDARDDVIRGFQSNNVRNGCNIYYR